MSNCLKNKKILLLKNNCLPEDISDFLQNNGYIIKSIGFEISSINKEYENFSPDIVIICMKSEENLNNVQAVYKELKQMKTPIMFITNNTSETMFKKIKEISSYGFIVKDTDKYVILSIIETFLKIYKSNFKKTRNYNHWQFDEDSPVGILKCDAKGNIIYANKRVLEILGSPSIKETKKINLLNFPLLIKFGLSNKLKYCLENKKSKTFEIKYKSKWGKNLWLRIHIKTNINKNKVLGAQIILDDITDKKLKEERLKHLSNTDFLTNTYNRRYFNKRLEEEIERANITNRKFSLIMLDIDHFKKINDEFGHHAGDLVLKSIAQLIKNRIRKTDILARWGGEEFIILLPETEIKNAAILAEDLRNMINNLKFKDIGNVTVSLGVDNYHSDDTIDSIIKRVDKHLYASKSAGRNCVVTGI
ncbi:diguanylate cyclase [Caloramator sp. E03]|uniref:diguanylate cyclase n=1 Tax=Caloramator sp. E03 TaxID=2576307 RepID=UPI001FA9C78E|nr:diguanylate cyclase [Caloramator sp. E03]